MKRPLFRCVVPVKGARPFLDAGQSDALNRGGANVWHGTGQNTPLRVVCGI